MRRVTRGLSMVESLTREVRSSSKIDGVECKVVREVRISLKWKRTPSQCSTVTVGASLLAMVVNDNAGFLI